MRCLIAIVGGFAIVGPVGAPALAARPSGTDVADALVAGGVPITYSVTVIGHRSAVTATDAADISITVYKRTKAREKAQVRGAKRLAKAVTESTALPYYA